VIRSPRLLVGLIASALLLSACGSDVPRSAAATVGDAEIARADLEDWVRQAKTANPAIDEAALQRDLLGRAIQARIVEFLLADLELEVAPADIERVRAAIAEEIGGADALAATLADIGFTEDFFDSVFLFIEAGIDAIVVTLAAGSVSETRTARHILVDSAEEADEIVQLLRDGADFADLARERSTDPGSAQDGGSLGPQERGVFVPQFDAAVWSAALDVVLDPVQSEFGFHVIEVVAEDTTRAEDLELSQQRLLVAGELNAILDDAIDRLEVLVDRRIVTWDQDSVTIQPADALR
jgi:parvulin-like peptidyl-prolyl isomerase